MQSHDLFLSLTEGARCVIIKSRVCCHLERQREGGGCQPARNLVIVPGTVRTGSGSAFPRYRKYRARRPIFTSARFVYSGIPSTALPRDVFACWASVCHEEGARRGGEKKYISRRKKNEVRRAKSTGKRDRGGTRRLNRRDA